MVVDGSSTDGLPTRSCAWRAALCPRRPSPPWGRGGARGTSSSQVFARRALPGSFRGAAVGGTESRPTPNLASGSRQQRLPAIVAGWLQGPTAAQLRSEQWTVGSGRSPRFHSLLTLSSEALQNKGTQPISENDVPSDFIARLVLSRGPGAAKILCPSCLWNGPFLKHGLSSAVPLFGASVVDGTPPSHSHVPGVPSRCTLLVVGIMSGILGMIFTDNYQEAPRRHEIGASGTRAAGTAKTAARARRVRASVISSLLRCGSSTGGPPT